MLNKLAKNQYVKMTKSDKNDEKNRIWSSIK